MTESTVRSYVITKRGASHSRREYMDGTPARAGDGKHMRSAYKIYNYDTNRIIRLTEEEAASENLRHLGLEPAVGTASPKAKAKAPATDVAGKGESAEKTPKEAQDDPTDDEGEGAPEGDAEEHAIPSNWRILKTAAMQDLVEKITGERPADRKEALAALEDIVAKGE